MTCSMIAWRRWSASAVSIGSGESVNTAWWRQTRNSSPCAFSVNVVGVGVADSAHDQPCRDLPSFGFREVNAVNGISATSASLTHCPSWSSKTARG